MANTYTLIASNTISTPSYSVTFSSIPQTYTDLKLVFSARSDYGSAGGSEVSIQLNSITSGYTSSMIYTNSGTSVSSATSSNPFFTWGGGMVNTSSTANIFANSELYIPNYTLSRAKSAVTDSMTENNGSAIFGQIVAHQSTNTAAVDSITIYAWQSFIKFVANSTFYLYGVSNA